VGRRLVAAALVVGLAGCTDSAGLTVGEAYSPLPPTADVAAVYLVIRNPTTQADTLIDVATPSARRAELHLQVTQDGMMFQMERVATLPVPAGDSVSFTPGGLHIMLFDLTTRPAAGDTVDLVLRFRHAGTVPVRAIVKSRSDIDR